jgi:hypothetical protein
VATLPQALGLRLAWSFEWLGGPVVGYLLYAALAAGFLVLLLRRPPQLAPLLLVVVVFPVFYFVSPYTWLNTEPRYLTLVMPVFALLAAAALTKPAYVVAAVLCAAALSTAGLVELHRHDVAAFRTEGTAVPADLSPVLATLRSNHIGYAFASYWVSWRITFESDVRIVGAKANYVHPFARNGRVHPGDPLGDLGTDARYYLEADRHRDVAHVFVRGGDLEPHARALLRRTGYRRVVSGDFAVWLPPGA